MANEDAKFKAIAKLKVSNNNYVAGRNDELNEIRKFIHSHSESGGALLIFGPCGSGKTVCMRKIISEGIVSNCHYITCYSFSRIVDFFKCLLDIVSNESCGKANKIAKNKECAHDFKNKVNHWLSQFKFLVSKLTRSILIVLDEIDVIDSLCSANSSLDSKDFIIQELFNIVSNNGKFVLVAISNNLELASYICGAKVSRLPFKPYLEDQLLSIITQKLNCDKVINKTALKVVVRRIVNSTNGDCRKCMDIFSRAISEFLYNNHIDETNENVDKNGCEDDNYNELVTPKRCRSDYEHLDNSYSCTRLASEIGIQDINNSTPTLIIGNRDSLDAKIQSIPTIQQIVLYSLLQLTKTDFLEEIPFQVIAIATKNIMNELQLNESYQLSLDNTFDHLEALGVIERKHEAVIIKPSISSLISVFDKIPLFKHLTVPRINGECVKNSKKRQAYTKRSWWRRR